MPRRNFRSCVKMRFKVQRQALALMSFALSITGRNILGRNILKPFRCSTALVGHPLRASSI